MASSQSDASFIDKNGISRFSGRGEGLSTVSTKGARGIDDRLVLMPCAVWRGETWRKRDGFWHSPPFFLNLFLLVEGKKEGGRRGGLGSLLEAT